MDDMREIVTVDQINRWFLLLAIAVPVLGILIGAAAGARHGLLKQSALKGLIVGLLGPLNLVLWKLYNTITDRLGLDSVKNLLVQLGLFLALGTVAGLIIGRFWRPASSTGDSGWQWSYGSPDSGGGAPIPAGIVSSSPTSASAARSFEEAVEPPREP